MEYGFQLFGMEPAKVRDLAQSAEGMGYDLSSSLTISSSRGQSDNTIHTRSCTI